MNYDKLKEELTLDDLKEMAKEVISWNGQLDYLDYFDNDEYFFRDLFGDKVDEAVMDTYMIDEKVAKMEDTIILG